MYSTSITERSCCCSSSMDKNQRIKKRFFYLHQKPPKSFDVNGANRWNLTKTRFSPLGVKILKFFWTNIVFYLLMRENSRKLAKLFCRKFFFKIAFIVKCHFLLKNFIFKSKKIMNWYRRLLYFREIKKLPVLMLMAFYFIIKVILISIPISRETFFTSNKTDELPPVWPTTTIFPSAWIIMPLAISVSHSSCVITCPFPFTEGTVRRNVCVIPDNTKVKIVIVGLRSYRT